MEFQKGGTNSQTMAAKAELRRIAKDAREKVIELLVLQCYIEKPLRKNLDVSKIVAAVHEACEDVIIAAAIEARPHCEHMDTCGGKR